MLGWFRKPATTAPPGAVTRDVIEGRCHVQLDLTPQVLWLQTKVWAILGWATRELRVSFATTPEAHVLRGRADVLFLSSDKRIAYPVFVETYVKRLLDRDEFRAHCDRYQTRSRILENL